MMNTLKFYGHNYGSGDFPEDFPHENGMYLNTCMHCRVVFLGHKRRHKCKVCLTKDTEEFNSLTDEQKEEIYRTFASGPVGVPGCGIM